MGRRTLPRALAPWALDSGGFTEVGTYGGWSIGPREYAAEVRRFRDEIGLMEWASIQDWMCEPKVLARTGKSVAEHQGLTIRNFLDLASIAPDIPWIPVLQGWEPADYIRHANDYAAAGVDLTAAKIVGVGTVCRRQGGLEALGIFRSISRLGIRCHGFGVKLDGLRLAAPYHRSADSMAWSSAACWRPEEARCSGPRTHKTCANCQPWASTWRSQVLTTPGVVEI